MHQLLSRVVMLAARANRRAAIFAPWSSDMMAPAHLRDGRHHRAASAGIGHHRPIRRLERPLHRRGEASTRFLLCDEAIDADFPSGRNGRPMRRSRCVKRWPLWRHHRQTFNRRRINEVANAVDERRGRHSNASSPRLHHDFKKYERRWAHCWLMPRCMSCGDTAARASRASICPWHDGMPLYV